MKDYCQTPHKHTVLLVVFCTLSFFISIWFYTIDTSIEDRVPLPEDRVPLSEDRVPWPENRVPLPENRVPLPENRVPLPEDRVPLRNITGRLWISEELYKLFTYKQLLQAKHNFNKRHIEAMRNEIEDNLGQNLNKLLFVDKGNSNPGTKLRYAVNSKSYYTVTKRLYNRLPKGPIVDKLRRCSIVGNSGSILNSTCGKHVDEADFVYRCNAAPLAPFVVDAGSKSNITSLNPSIFKLRYNDLNKDGMLRFLRDMTQYHGYLWGSCLNFDGLVKPCLKALESYNIKENLFVLGHPDHFRKIMEFWKKRGNITLPSTGFYYTSDALSRCDEVHLYGFWPFSSMVDTDIHKLNYHYFDEMKFSNSSVHMMNVEFAILIQLHLLGVIKLHVGTCT